MSRPPQPAPVAATPVANALEEDPWDWPIDLARYDRAPLPLTDDEAAALDTLGWGVRWWRRSNRAEWRRLERLVRPLSDACFGLHIPATSHHRRAADYAVAMVLQACAETGLSFWSWDPASWVAVVGADQEAFFRRYPSWADGGERSYLVALAYLLSGFTAFELLGKFNRLALARRIFGPRRVDTAVGRITTVLQGWGYHSTRTADALPGILCQALLVNRSPRLCDLTLPALERLRSDPVGPPAHRSMLFGVHRALAALGLVDPPAVHWCGTPLAPEGVASVWQDSVYRWHATSALTPTVRRSARGTLFKVGRWLAVEHPAVEEPRQWTRELCAAYVAAVDRFHIGDYSQRRKPMARRLGEPLSARTKASYVAATRQFFRDLQEWGWIPRRFDPARALATPRSIRALLGPNPRIIAEDSWAKLLWAGLNLQARDLPANVSGQFYPLELVRALALTWLFGGLRSDELVRLRVGCVRWQHDDVAVPGRPGETLQKDAICLLDVPTHKTGNAFTKPVDPLVGQAITVWEAARPAQPLLLDRRTGERVSFVFCYRAHRVAKTYINAGIIPALCRKAAVPLADTRGAITSHRARATIASQLYNAKEPMTLFELQAWLGHRSPETTQHYAKITPTTLAKAYADAGYFARNVRTIAVLVDRDAVQSGASAQGQPWQYFDLGGGYCTYNFFEQCPHRMACARCDFYLPKSTTTVQLLEARGNLQRMLAEIPLTDDERAAVEDGTAAVEHLLERLEDVPTPAGPTPRQLAERTTNFIPLSQLDPSMQSIGGRQ
ncbi:MAG: tyrosine-type recombinase/integrase [Chloroflexota bacterium]|nr:tyrosine-type recombinase/integrase [Chloroflexota bacterium]